MAFSSILRVVVSNGLSEATFTFEGPVDVARAKSAICREYASRRPSDVLLFHEGVALANDAIDLRSFPLWRGELRLGMVVTIFNPR